MTKKSAIQSRSSDPFRNASFIRPLIREGGTVLAYVLGRPPELALVRRYVRAVMAVADLGPGSPETVLWPHWWPHFFLRFLEPLGPPRSRRQEIRMRRLYIACVLAETTPRGAGRFVAFEGRAKASVWAALFLLGIVEVLVAPFRLLVTVTGR